MEARLAKYNTLIFDERLKKSDIRSFMYENIRAGNSKHDIRRQYKHQIVDRRKLGRNIGEFIAKLKGQKDNIVPEVNYINWIKYNCNSYLVKKLEPQLINIMGKWQNGEWLHIPYSDYLGEIDNNSFLLSKHQNIQVLHNIHESIEDPVLIAYYPTLEHLRLNRIVKTKLGKYLTKFQNELGLTDAQIKLMVEKHNARLEARSGWSVKFIESNDPDGWQKVYADCEYKSCMTTETKAKPYVRSYAHDKSVLRLAYLQSGDVIKARCIVREDDPDNLQWIRTYPPADQSAEGTYLKSYLESNGYKRGDLMGVLLKTWWHEDGCWASPYVDWGNGDEPYGDHKSIDDQDYIKVNEDGDLSLNHTDGTTWREDDEDDEDNDEDYTSCQCCDEGFYRDDLNDDDECEHCENNYTWAYSRNGDHAYVSNENVIEIGGESYDTHHLSDYDIYPCEHDNEYYHIDDLVNTSMGYIYHAYAIALDHADNDGNDYAHQDDVAELPDGTNCHKDNFELLNETIQKGLENESAIT
jgi:hypothetical protein